MGLCTNHISRSSSPTHTFYGPGAATPVARPIVASLITHPLSSLDGPRGSGHPDPDSFAASQYNQLPRSRSTSRSSAPCHGFHDSSR
jgi:hypothetical protein